MSVMKVFTDASFWGNPHKSKNANVGIFIPDINIQFKEEIKVKDNNEAEYFAIFKALEILEKELLHPNVNVTIISDAKVCTYSLNQYITTGVHRPNKYNNIQFKIIELIKRIAWNISFIHQKAHSKFDGTINWLGNNIADKLSKNKMNEIDREYLNKYLKKFNDIFFVPQPKKTYNDAWD
jgi:ribonuclease HI